MPRYNFSKVKKAPWWLYIVALYGKYSRAQSLCTRRKERMCSLKYYRDCVPTRAQPVETVYQEKGEDASVLWIECVLSSTVETMYQEKDMDAGFI